MARQTKTTVHLSGIAVKRLELHGARPDRSHGPWNRSNIMRRQLELLDSVLIYSDPRKTRDFSQSYFELVMTLVPEPWKLTVSEIATLHAHLKHLPDFRQATAAAGVDPKAFLNAVEELSYAEKLALVDQADLRHAPTASGDGQD